MKPYLAVARRELREQLLQPRAALLLLLMFFFFWLALAQGGERLRLRESQSAASAQANWEGWLAQKPQHPHGAAHYPMLVLKPSGPLAGLAAGVEEALGAHVFIDPHRIVPVGGVRASDAPYAQAVGQLDLAFVVAAVLSLLAALGGTDLVAGEKERGTLRLSFANELGRARWFGAKLLARSASLLALCGLAAALAWPLAGGMPVPAAEAWRLWALAGASALYLLWWLCCGAACSAWFPRSSTAALVALAVWILGALVLPRVLVALGELGAPSPATAPALMSMRVEAVKLRREQMALIEKQNQTRDPNRSAIALAEGSAAIRESIDAKALRQRGEAESQQLRWREEQLGRLGTLAGLSPAALYAGLATALAGTDWGRHKAFLEQADRYRHDFIGRLNGLEAKGITLYKDYATMPRFAFQEASQQELLGSQAPTLLALLAGALLWLGLGAWGMRRLDLR